MRKAKWLVAAACIFSATLTAAPVTLTRSGDKVDIAIGGKAFTTYEFSEAIAKPFLMPRCEPPRAS